MNLIICYLYLDNVGVNDVKSSDDEFDSNKLVSNRKQSSKKRVDYIKWSNDEIKAVERSLEKFIALRKIPQQHDCLLAMKKEPILNKRSWKKIKFQVANTIKKSLK